MYVGVFESECGVWVCVGLCKRKSPFEFSFVFVCLFVCVDVGLGLGV